MRQFYILCSLLLSLMLFSGSLTQSCECTVTDAIVTEIIQSQDKAVKPTDLTFNISCDNETQTRFISNVSSRAISIQMEYRACVNSTLCPHLERYVMDAVCSNGAWNVRSVEEIDVFVNPESKLTCSECVNESLYAGYPSNYASRRLYNATTHCLELPECKNGSKTIGFHTVQECCIERLESTDYVWVVNGASTIIPCIVNGFYPAKYYVNEGEMVTVTFMRSTKGITQTPRLDLTGMITATGDLADVIVKKSISVGVTGVTGGIPVIARSDNVSLEQGDHIVLSYLSTQHDLLLNGIEMFDEIISTTAEIFIIDNDPDVSVILGELGSREVGSNYTLICTVNVSKRVRDDSVSIHWLGPSTDQEIIDTTNNTVIITQLTLDPLSLGHNGSYICTVNYTAEASSLTRSNRKDIIPVLLPPILMIRKSSEQTLLVGDKVVLYCDITLIGVLWMKDVNVDITWLQDEVLIVTDSRVRVSPVTESVGGIVNSDLTIGSVQISDEDTYQCNVTLTPLLGQLCLISSSSSIFLNVTEPVDPVKPENISFRDVNIDSLQVQWTVSYISYSSQEIYVVQYGNSRHRLVYNSNLIHSENGVTTYSVDLSGLRANTTYYVQVLSTNTAQRSTRSSIESFTILLNNIISSGNSVSDDVTAPVLGGILSLIILLMFVIAVILLILNCRLKSKLAIKRKVAEEIDIDIKSVPTDSNAAYGKLSAVDVAIYELVELPSSASPAHSGHIHSDNTQTIPGSRL